MPVPRILYNDDIGAQVPLVIVMYIFLVSGFIAERRGFDPEGYECVRVCMYVRYIVCNI